MNQKHHLLDFQQLADEAGLHIFCLAPLKDRYKENHVYQEGGILYLFLKKPEEKDALLALIQSRPEIEAVMTNKEPRFPVRTGSAAAGHPSGCA